MHWLSHDDQQIACVSLTQKASCAHIQPSPSLISHHLLGHDQVGGNGAQDGPVVKPVRAAGCVQHALHTEATLEHVADACELLVLGEGAAGQGLTVSCVVIHLQGCQGEGGAHNENVAAAKHRSECMFFPR